MAEYILAHDLGTSGNKATLFSTDGVLIGSRTVAYPVYYDQPLWAEQDPEDWWCAVCSSTKELIEAYQVSPEDIKKALKSILTPSPFFEKINARMAEYSSVTQSSNARGYFVDSSNLSKEEFRREFVLNNVRSVRDEIQNRDEYISMILYILWE